MEGSAIRYSAKKILVYTTGTFDLFHVGHLNMLKAAKALGDVLIVGVSTDELVQEYKNRRPIIPFEERIRIVSELRCVDICVPQYTRDKFEAWKRLGFDVWVVGDDWYGKPDTEQWKNRLEEVGVRVVFLPYTRSVSSTKIREKLQVAGSG